MGSINARSTGLRKVMKALISAVASLRILLLLAFVVYVYLYDPRKAEPFEFSSLDSGTRILIATQKTEFKDALVRLLADSLKQDSVSIKGIDIG